MSSSGRDSMKGAVVPSHLQYRPPRVQNEFKYVESRYMSPQKRADPEGQMRDRLNASRVPSPPRSREFDGVGSRYLSPKKKPMPRDATQAVDPTLAAHKRFAREQGVAATPSKFFDVHMHPPPASTPRSVIEDRQRKESDAVKKDGQAFRLKHVKEANFKQMERSNRELQERWNSPTKRSSAHHSVVMAFVNDNVPIPGYEPTEPKKVEREPKMGQTAFLSGGGAGGGNFFRRTNSPTKIQTAVQEKKVSQLSTTLRSARTASPPRVATLESRQARAKRDELIKPPVPNMALRGGAPLRSPNRLTRQTSPSPAQRTVSPTKVRSDSPTKDPTRAATSRTSYYKRDTTLFDTQPPKISAFR